MWLKNNVARVIGLQFQRDNSLKTEKKTSFLSLGLGTLKVKSLCFGARRDHPLT